MTMISLMVTPSIMTLFYQNQKTDIDRTLLTELRLLNSNVFQDFNHENSPT